MTVGCGFATEPNVKTEEARSGEILPEEETDTPLKDNGKTQRSHKKIHRENGRF